MYFIKGFLINWGGKVAEINITAFTVYVFIYIVITCPISQPYLTWLSCNWEDELSLISPCAICDELAILTYGENKTDER